MLCATSDFEVKLVVTCDPAIKEFVKQVIKQLADEVETRLLEDIVLTEDQALSALEITTRIEE